MVAFYTSCIALFKPVFTGRIAGLNVADAHMAIHMFVSVNDEEADTLQINLLSLQLTYVISDEFLSDFEVQVLFVKSSNLS